MTHFHKCIRRNKEKETKLIVINSIVIKSNLDRDGIYSREAYDHL